MNIIWICRGKSFWLDPLIVLDWRDVPDEHIDAIGTYILNDQFDELKEYLTQYNIKYLLDGIQTN